MNKIRIDDYLNREFRRHSYNCWDFVRDIWKDLTGVDLGHQTPNDPSVGSYTQRALEVASRLTPLESVEDPCIVLFQRKRLAPHVGVYYRGKVLHMNPRGAEYRALDQVSANFTSVQFYR